MTRKQDLGAISRRSLMTGAAAFAAMSSTSLKAEEEDDRGSILAYVGTYTPNGQGIYLFRASLATGALTQLKVFPTTNPSWLAFDPSRTHLYAANEISNFSGTTTGAVSAYSINRTNGDLTFLNIVSSQGAGPAHLSVHPSGRYVLVANYGGGNIAVLPILANGSLGNATDVQPDVGPVGPIHAVDAPPGSFAVSGHDAPHAHMIQSDPAGNFVFVADLGLDRVFSWRLNLTTGKLSPNSPAFIQTSPGAGPRHFAFHPNAQWFYLLNEEASTLSFYRYNATGGTLTLQQTLSTLPREFTGTNFTNYGATTAHHSVLGGWDVKQAETINGGSQVILSPNSSLNGAGTAFTVFEGGIV